MNREGAKDAKIFLSESGAPEKSFRLSIRIKMSCMGYSKRLVIENPPYPPYLPNKLADVPQIVGRTADWRTCSSKVYDPPIFVAVYDPPILMEELKSVIEVEPRREKREGFV